MGRPAPPDPAPFPFPPSGERAVFGRGRCTSLEQEESTAELADLSFLFSKLKCRNKTLALKSKAKSLELRNSSSHLNLCKHWNNNN